MNGREEAMIPTFHNSGNHCYSISVMVALIRCMSFLDENPSCNRWGFLARIWQIAHEQAIASLEALGPFGEAINTWALPDRQHDAAEFTQHIGAKVPVMCLQRSQLRLHTPYGVSVESYSQVAQC